MSTRPPLSDEEWDNTYKGPWPLPQKRSGPATETDQMKCPHGVVPSHCAECDEGNKRAEPQLPPLPQPAFTSFQSDSTMRYTELHSFSATQMGDYARAALAAEREPSPTLVHPTASDSQSPEAADMNRRRAFDGSPEDVILRLKAKLRVVTDAYEMLLDDGKFPTKSRTVDGREADAAWWERQYDYIKEAREALATEVSDEQ